MMMMMMTKAKLKRSPSSYTAIDKKDWPRPQNVTDLLIHAIKGGGRAFLLAYGIRAGVIFCLSLLRVMRKRAAFGNIITASLKNETALRFAGMFGSFAFLWKLVNNGMRIYRDKDDRLNGLVAGAVAGLAILCEKQEKRVDIAQQLFVRALQGVYNAGKARDILYFKHGDALLFGLACGQILYAYTMQPHTLDPGYYNFMVKTARVPGDLLKLNAKNVRGFPVSQEEALAAVNKFRPTKKALAITKANARVSSCHSL